MGSYATQFNLRISLSGENIFEKPFIVKFNQAFASKIGIESIDGIQFKTNENHDGNKLVVSYKFSTEEKRHTIGIENSVDGMTEPISFEKAINERLASLNDMLSGWQ